MTEQSGSNSGEREWKTVSHRPGWTSADGTVNNDEILMGADKLRPRLLGNRGLSGLIAAASGEPTVIVHAADTDDYVTRALAFKPVVLSEGQSVSINEIMCARGLDETGMPPESGSNSNRLPE